MTDDTQLRLALLAALTLIALVSLAMGQDSYGAEMSTALVTELHEAAAS